MEIDLLSINPTAVILAIGAFAILVGAIASSGSGGNNGSNTGGTNHYNPQINSNFHNNQQSVSRPNGAQKPFGNLFGNKNNMSQPQSSGIFNGQSNYQNQNNHQNQNANTNFGSFQGQNSNGSNQGSNQGNSSQYPNNNNGML